MKSQVNKTQSLEITPQESQVSIRPAVIAGICLLIALVLTTLIIYPSSNATNNAIFLLLGILGAVYLVFFYSIYTTAQNKNFVAWLNVIIASIGLGVISIFIPDELNYLVFILMFTSAISTSVISTRLPSYTLILLVGISHLYSETHHPSLPNEWVIHFGLTIASVMAVETIQRLKNLMEEQIHKLEILNEVSKQIVSTLEKDQILSLLNAAFQKVLDADSYYIGLIDKDVIQMQLFYDDGEYFNGARMQIEGTLSGWVINNQKELFLPDLRKPLELDGINLVLIGQSKDSLSWMGVPVKGVYTNGIMAIASYKPNAFNKSDLELLNGIAQRAAYALDNAYSHEHAQMEARLDSLTRVYNHGYFIKALHEKADECSLKKQPLSLIMLDIDYFKNYNDQYGHQTGDKILITLCSFIKEHIKAQDAVGRWGGEEFAIVLPNVNGTQAIQVAQRIQQSMETLKLEDPEHGLISAPTISQGIAVYPNETMDISKLIDLADERLYKAKGRGRNQIEPAPSDNL
ncbi:MAG: sensor domain-containing diguanylate cyclase [Anaerolineales bacterium]